MHLRRALLVLLAASGAAALPAGAAPPRGAPACSVFPVDNVWHADVSGLPVHPSSGAWLASMGGGDVHLHPDFGPSDGPQPYGIPYTAVDADHEKVAVTFEYADESDPGPYPFGADTPIESGSDRHALMIDRDACRLYELYDATYSPAGSTAGSGAVFDLRSNALRPSGWTSADAAGLPIFAGLLRLDEVAAGNVDHAIRMTASKTDKTFVWPARHQAGAAEDGSLPPMGAWFRLKPAFDVSRFRPDTQTVLRAMQRHGMIVADNGSDWFFTGASEPGWDPAMLDELKSVTAAEFEAVEASSLMVDPNSAQVNGQQPRGGTVTAPPAGTGAAPTQTATPRRRPRSAPARPTPTLAVREPGEPFDASAFVEPAADEEDEDAVAAPDIVTTRRRQAVPLHARGISDLGVVALGLLLAVMAAIGGYVWRLASRPSPS